MADRHASHQASELAAANVVVKRAASRRPYRLGGLLRWDESGGWRLARRAVALVTAVQFALWPVMETAAAAENARVAADARVAANIRVAAISPARLPLEVAPPAFTLVTAGAPASLSHDGAEVKVPAGALATGGVLSIRPLAAREVARMNPGLINVTRGPRSGYRMEPSGHFGGQVAITLPYDRKLLPEGTPERDLRIFWYDTAKKRWTPLQRASVDARDQTVTGWTDHFTDFITGVVNVPNHQQAEGFTPTQIAGLKAADPGAKINLIEAPQANSTGDARLSYPIELPPGRNGHQPQLAITYDSSRGNGWLGTGWGLDISSIDIDTRWGVPRYDTGQIDGTPNGLETETYLLNGAQLAPVANRGALIPRTANKTFSLRVEGEFLKIVRHGSSPSTYFWEVTAKDGTRSLYGGSLATNSVDPQAVLSDPTTGNIARWMLREVIDTNGNNIRFFYDVVTLTSNGGLEPARQIYPNHIAYTGRTGGADGPYQVVFVHAPGRADPIVDGRFGFKTVMDQLLTEVDVNLTSGTSTQPIRSYQLAYSTGQFNKTLLQTITQNGTDGTQFNQHKFGYFDEVGNGTTDPAMALNAFGGGVTVPGAGTTPGSGFVSDQSGTAFSGEANSSGQTHLYTGITVSGFTGFAKEVSGGFKFGAENGNANLSQILIDINGDGRADQVYVSDGRVFWRPNTGTLPTPGSPGTLAFGAPRQISGLSAIDVSSSSTFTQGGEVFVGAGAGMLDQSNTRTSEGTYFSDVNGDGLPDLVVNTTVWFNQGVDANGNLSFVQGSSPTPLGSRAVTNTAGLIAITPDLQAAAQNAFPLIDSVRRWVAPFTGTIDVTGPIQLMQPTSPAANGPNADGVRVAVQLEDSELFSLTIAPDDGTTKQITGLTGLQVTAGQRLYFRVDSINDGTSDTVSFDPTITYRTVNGATVDPATLDESGLPTFVFTASADYAYAGRPMPVIVPADGTAVISGALAKPSVTTDDVTFTITRTRTDGTTVSEFTRVFPAAATGTESILDPRTGQPLILSLNAGEMLVARINSDTRINLSGIAFTPTVTYQTLNGAPAPTKNGTPLLSQALPATAQVFAVAPSGTPQTAWSAPGGPVEVTQTVSGTGPAGLNGQITLAAKSGGVLLGKQVVSIVNGAINGTATLDVTFNLPAGTPVFFTVEASDPALLSNFTVSAPTDTAGNVLPFDVRVDTAVSDTFGGGYRNWWFADYTPADPSAPIDQTLLRFPAQPTDPHNLDPVFQRFLQMLPFQNDGRWQARDANAFVSNTFTASDGTVVSGSFMGSTRAGARTISLSDGTEFGGAQGIVKTGSAVNNAGSISLLVFGHGESQGTSGSDIDFLDFNGDGYPDVVGGGAVQATLPNGALEGRRIGLGSPSRVRQNSDDSINDSLGATTSQLRATAQLFGLDTDSEQAPYNIIPSVGASVSSSHGTTTAQWDLIDINGDGLPDLVQPASGGPNVRLNLGYRFGLPETWNVPAVRVDRTSARGFEGNAGFTLPAYSFGGGISSTQNAAGTETSLLDVNGDGLPDLVFKPVDTTDGTVASGGNQIQVSLNTGAGFLAPQTWNGALPAPIQSRSGAYRKLGLHFSISIPITPVVGLVINPGHNNGDSISGSLSQVRDLDGDGYPDHIQATGAAVTASLNQRGRTNLLKSISRPLGATVTLDYTRAGNTTDMPQNRWVMTSRTVFDGLGATLAADGDIAGAAHYQVATFDYQNGKWDRAERTFYGFATVTEQHRTTDNTFVLGTTDPASLPVFRSIIESFRTDSFYTKGLLAQQVSQTGAGARFLETDNTYNVVTVTPGVTGLENFTDVRFPQLSQRNKLFFEGQATAGEQTSETFAYDGFGNVTQYADLGDAGTADDVFATIHYTGDAGGNPLCITNYIVGIADRVTVTDVAGNQLRRREADVDCTTGNVTENRRFLANGSAAITDMTYDGEGKLTAVTGPANLNGERYSLTYNYDTTVDIYVEKVTDSFGYFSTSTHDFRFGEVTSTTDENAQVITNSYDNFGRLIHVTGPYEQGTVNTTIDLSYAPVDPSHAPPVPFAQTSHIDTLGPQPASGVNHIRTVLFTDGLKRALQTKKDAAVSPQAGTAPAHVATVSGRVIFDPFGRTIRQFYPVTETLDAQSNIQTGFKTDRDTTAPPTLTAFDILDRVTSITIPDNTTTTTAYDFGADRGGQTRFRTTVTDANNVRKEQFRDVRSQIVTVNEFNNGGSSVFHTSYAYDPVRQITGVTDDQGNVTSVAYDLFGRRTEINSPDAGRTTFAYDLADNLTAKQTANLRASGGQQVTFGYQFNRVTSIIYPNFPANNVAYTYGAAAQRGQGAPLIGNVVGRITHIADGAGTEDRLYGPLGEIVQETRAIPIQGNQVPTYTTKFTYDTWNRIAQIIYPDPPTGEVVKYFYDSGGLVTRVHGNDDQLEVDYASNITYDKFGQRLSMTNGNGAVTTYAYRPDNRRLASVKATLAMGYTFNDFGFTYDPVGNLTQLQNNAQFPGSFTGGNLGNAIGGPWTKTFNYDDLYRLISSTGTHSISASPTDKFTYSFSQSYDSIHNITHKTQTAMQNTAVNPQITYDFAYTYPAPGSAHPHGPTAIGPFTISNDPDGNQVNTLGTGTSDQSEYLYDEENRLSCANKGPQVPSPSCNAQGNTSFIYDHAGVRKVKTQSSPVIYPNQYYTDFGGGAGSQFKHVFIGSERILTKKARIAPDRQHWYYHPDHLGSTAMVTNENGQLVDAVHYFPFGEVWLEERPSSLPADYFFTAKELDPETGFYDFGARYLDPRFSKWMTADPALGKYMPSAGMAVAYQSPSLANRWRTNVNLPGLGGLFRPSNLSAYSYGANNPASLLDPDGEELREFRAPIGTGDSPKMLLDSQMVGAAEKFIQAVHDKGIDLRVSNVFRTTAEQAAIPKNNPFGRAQAGRGLHEAGLAFDIKPGIWKSLTQEQKDMVVKMAGDYGLGFELLWGGNFPPVKQRDGTYARDEIHFFRDPWPHDAPDYKNRKAFIVQQQQDYQTRFGGVAPAAPAAPTNPTAGTTPNSASPNDGPANNNNGPTSNPLQDFINSILQIFR